MGDMNEGLNAVATLIIAAGGDQSEFTIEDVSSKGALLRCRVNFLSQPPDLSCPDQIDGNGCRADL
ncbi:hypothetical protein K461DRAFT_281793 [Myriangium duriaei CBS 260.36]|uniref:Uncharacterized protein n=1 Tax=Myriangium duriaei CBS 260.36 TaxID=1168546 RepID=A0A9P4IX24_9PEZI|nr:hypothetical protein K461DRAFT_281793 [Myriangium duriaei CBS 260.36]